MGVVGGLVFAMVLWTLSLIPPIALRCPVKKIAAVVALIVRAAYLVVSGSSVPALGSFVLALRCVRCDSARPASDFDARLGARGVDRNAAIP